MRPVNKNGYLCKIPFLILQAAYQVMYLAQTECVCTEPLCLYRPLVGLTKANVVGVHAVDDG